MKKIKTLLLMLGFVAVMTSCTMTLPVAATSNDFGNKVGTAKATVIIGLFFDQDASIKAACANGGITKISTVDVKQTNILNLFMTFETIVTGE